MKTEMHRSLLFGAGLLLACISSLGAQDNAPGASMREVEEQVQKRRQMREEVHAASLIGGVFQPMKNDGLERASLEIHDQSVRESAQTYANLTGKEVMVSAKVATNRISVSRKSLSRSEAIKAMESAFGEVGVAIVPLVESTVALVDAAALAKESGRKR
jgi:hypothetical protein